MIFHWTDDLSQCCYDVYIDVLDGIPINSPSVMFLDLNTIPSNIKSFFLKHESLLFWFTEVFSDNDSNCRRDCLEEKNPRQMCKQAALIHHTWMSLRDPVYLVVSDTNLAAYEKKKIWPFLYFLFLNKSCKPSSSLWTIFVNLMTLR